MIPHLNLFFGQRIFSASGMFIKNTSELGANNFLGDSLCASGRALLLPTCESVPRSSVFYFSTAASSSQKGVIDPEANPENENRNNFINSRKTWSHYGKFAIGLISSFGFGLFLDDYWNTRNERFLVIQSSMSKLDSLIAKNNQLFDEIHLDEPLSAFAEYEDDRSYAAKVSQTLSMLKRQSRSIDFRHMEIFELEKELVNVELSFRFPLTVLFSKFFGHHVEKLRAGLLSKISRQKKILYLSKLVVGAMLDTKSQLHESAVGKLKLAKEFFEESKFEEELWGSEVYRAILANLALTSCRFADSALDEKVRQSHFNYARKTYFELEQSKMLAPHPTILVNKAILYRNILLEPEEALAAIKLAHSFAPMNLEVLNLYALILADFCDFESAATYFSLALRLSPESPSILNNQAVTLMKAGQAGDVLDIYNKIVPQVPGAMEFVLNRGLAYLLCNDLDLAEKDFEQALWMSKIQHEQILINYFLAMVYERKGDYQVALNLLLALRQSCVGKRVIYIDELFMSEDDFLAHLQGQIDEITAVKNEENSYKSGFNSWFFSFDRAKKIQQYREKHNKGSILKFR